MSTKAYNYQRFGWNLEDGAHERWLDEAPALGTEAPGCKLPDLDGRRHRLHGYRGHPVVIEFGSYTCPIFCGHLPAMEQVAREHPDTAFLVVYTREAHPGEVTPVHATQDDKRRAALLGAFIGGFLFPVPRTSLGCAARRCSPPRCRARVGAHPGASRAGRAQLWKAWSPARDAGPPPTRGGPIRCPLPGL